MITSSPRDSAVEAYSNIQSGVRCAETTLASNGTASSVSRSIAGCITVRSDLLPMMTPTRGFPIAAVLAVGIDGVEEWRETRKYTRARRDRSANLEADVVA